MMKLFRTYWLKNNMFGKKIVVVGGSIAGSAITVLLQNAGYQVTVLERSSGSIKEKNGTGVTLPLSLIKECMEHHLLDSNIPLFPANSRSFSIKNYDPIERESTKFWEQGLEVVTLNWKHIYENLRRRVNSAIYHPNSEVKNIKKLNTGYLIETANGKSFEADYIIAADGSNSFVRSLIVPKAIPKYSGYIAWRGVIELSEQEIFSSSKQIPYYMFKNGHILLYQIPDETYHQTGKVLLNWVLYEKFSEANLQDFMVDKNGIKHTGSVPAGYLGTNHLRHFQSLITKNLPNHVNSLINRTSEPFIQVVQDFQLPEYTDNRVIFVGDAALTLKPHTASGVLKALRNSMDLFKLIHNYPYENLDQLVTTWKIQQKKIASEEVIKSNIMGQNLVINTPDWERMNQEYTDLWWNNIMKGVNWYATKLSDQSMFKPKTTNNIYPIEEINNVQMAKL